MWGCSKYDSDSLPDRPYDQVQGRLHDVMPPKNNTVTKGLGNWAQILFREMLLNLFCDLHVDTRLSDKNIKFEISAKKYNSQGPCVQVSIQLVSFGVGWKSSPTTIATFDRTHHAGERTYNTLLKACEGFLNISPPLAGIIRRDPRVPESIRNQTSLLTRHPNSDAAGDVVAIAGKLLETP